MVDHKVDGVRLTQALEKFGSLEKAVDALGTQKKALEADVSALTMDQASRLGKIEQLDKATNEYKQNLTYQKEASQKYKQDCDEYMNSIKQFMQQYYMFESLIAMLLTSPSAKESMDDLATQILMWSKVVWDFYDQPDKLRYLFIQTVLGGYLKCYCCTSCGASFIVNRDAQSYLGYSCPSCGSTFYVRADDSFLKAMLGSSSKSTDTNETQAQEK